MNSDHFEAPLPRCAPPGCPLARTSHRCSSRGLPGAVPSGVFDSRGAEAYLTVRRAPLARTSHRCSSRGCRGAVTTGVFDPRGADAYLTVRRAPRGEKTSLGGVHRRPQQETGEKCGLGENTPPGGVHRRPQQETGEKCGLDNVGTGRSLVRIGQRSFDAPCPRRAPRGYSRPVAAVTCRRQVASVYNLGPEGPGYAVKRRSEDS